VLVASRSRESRDEIAAALSSRHGIEAFARDVGERWRFEEIEDVQPDVVVWIADGDASEPDALHEDALGPPIVLLTDDPRAPWIREEIGSHLRAVLPPDAGAEAIAAAVEAAAAGLVALGSDGVRSLLPAPRPGGPRRGAPKRLSPRETEVLRMIAEGLANKTIAWNLGISEHTVKFHLASLYSKLGVASRTEAVTEGLKRGLIYL